jgi:cytochrome c-type biogenesis protein CcmE
MNEKLSLKTLAAAVVLLLLWFCVGIARAVDYTPLMPVGSRGAMKAITSADKLVVPGTLEVTGASTFTGGIANGGTVTTIDIDGGTIDGATIGAAAAGAITGTTITGTTITDGTVSRTGGTVTGTWANLGSVTTIDINGGTIDGVTIGAAAAPTVTNLGSVATCDINGGTIDGVTIGGAAAGAATFTDLTASGTVSLPAACITSANLASGAGVAALLTAGLGGSDSYVKTDTGAQTLVAADATKDRAVLIVVVVDEVFATGDTSQTVVTVGEADTPAKFMADSVLVDAAAGTVFVFAGTNTATKAITATITAAVGTGTGGCTVTVLAIPTT